MVRVTVILLVVGCVAVTAAAKRVPVPHVNSLAWLAGQWHGSEGTAKTEEHWMRPVGDNMTGMFRKVTAEGAVSFVEIMTITTETTGTFLRIRHLDTQLSPKFGEKAPMVYRASWTGPSEARFTKKGAETHMISFHLRVPDTLIIRLHMTVGGKNQQKDFSFKRRPNP